MAANGIDVPTKILLSGTGVTNVAGPVYTVTLSLSGTSTVAITKTAKDAAGTTQSVTGSYTEVSYNTDKATVSGGTITAVAIGQAIVEFSYPSFDLDGTNDIDTGKIYAQVMVNVTA